LVEPPGTAPGSDPRITGAFMSIVPVAEDTRDIGAGRAGLKPLPGLSLALSAA